MAGPRLPHPPGCRAPSGWRSSCAIPTGSRCAPRTAGKVGASPPAEADTLTEAWRALPRPSPSTTTRSAASSIGAGWGRVEEEPMLVLGRLQSPESIGVEATVGQVQGVFSARPSGTPTRSELLRPAHLALRVGVGNFRTSRTPAWCRRSPPTQLANASIGVWHYLTERFVLRADYRSTRPSSTTRDSGE